MRTIQQQLDSVSSEKERITIELEAINAEYLKAFEEHKEGQAGRESLLERAEWER